MLPLVSNKFLMIWIHFMTYFTSFTDGWVTIGNSYTRDFFILFLIKLSSNKQMYCGKVLLHIYQTPHPALYVAVMTMSHCSKCPAGPCYDAITSSGGKLFPAWWRPTVLRQLQSHWLVGPICGRVELADKSWCWLLSHEVHQPKAWLTSQ